MIPLSLYIHIPWCIQKCPYCDFNSHKSPDVRPETAYIDALIADLDQDLSLIIKQPLHSVFIGGGTPSLLSAEAYDRLFKAIRSRLSLPADTEITMEANPGTVEQQRFNEYRAVGINRLSLGIQSFNATHLKTLGRIHDDKQAHKAIDAARKAGFDNINLDLMHGLPNQSIAEGLTDLKLAIDHQPEHLSWYQLTIEPNTVFYKTQPRLPDDDALSELEEQGFEALAGAGYARYEISAFSQPGRHSKHNLNYWQFGDYLGIGAGAHGKITDQGILRTRKQRQPKDYLHPEKAFMSATERVSAKDLVFEFMLNLSRLQEAIPLSLFYERTGLDWSLIAPMMQAAAEKKLIVLNDKYWQVSALGRRFTNDLQALFLG